MAFTPAHFTSLSSKLRRVSPAATLYWKLDPKYCGTQPAVYAAIAKVVLADAPAQVLVQPPPPGPAAVRSVAAVGEKKPRGDGKTRIKQGPRKI